MRAQCAARGHDEGTDRCWQRKEYRLVSPAICLGLVIGGSGTELSCINQRRGGVVAELAWASVCCVRYCVCTRCAVCGTELAYDRLASSTMT
eukprot:2660970-Rhodomonas_salina.1